MKLDVVDDDEGVSLYPSTKPVSELKNEDIYRVFHCDGLLLCVIRDTKWRVVWNPYLGDTRWIKPINDLHRFQRSDMFAFGYDINRNHKISRVLDVFHIPRLPEFFEIYQFNSNSWRVLDINLDCDLECGVSLKGHTYFFARRKIKDHHLPPQYVQVFLLCFDFTAEAFGPRLPLPFHPYLPLSLKRQTLSCVRDDHLALLYQTYNSAMEIWITTEIHPNSVSWSKFLKVDLQPFPKSFSAGSFFIDQDKKLALLLDTSYYHTAYITGEDGYHKSVKFGEAPNLPTPLSVSSYVPSLVQLQINQSRKRKEREY